MRTLSARILLGFIALMIAFGAFATTIVWNLREVEDQASLILRGYVPLALASSDLERQQGYLKAYLDQGITDATRAREIVSTITKLRSIRDSPLNEIVNKIDSLDRLATSDGQAAAEGAAQFSRTGPIVDDLKQAVSDAAPLYKTLLAAPPLRVPGRSDPSFQATYDALDADHRAAVDALLQLRDKERQVSSLVATIKSNFGTRTTRTRNWLADNERTILVRAIYLGLVTLLLGLVITAWVAVTLRPLRRLREGARRIAAGDYGKRIAETGPTEIADLAREFNSMGRAVQDREEEKLRAARIAMAGKMGGKIAHEVRNPLSSIELNTSLLEDEFDEHDSEPRELCRNIRNEIARLTEITEIYLGLRGGKPQLARESLNAIVDGLVGFVRKDLANRHVDLATELDPEDPVGHIDANQIRQCLINLVRNAADAVAGNGGGRVVIRTRSARGRVEVAVEDDGVGIASEQLPRLFEPFFSTKKGGTGLGLALTQQIIQDHGGEIQVASRVGRGTTFTLSVPAG
jgi:two-component system NtrC family sensor kinase